MVEESRNVYNEIKRHWNRRKGYKKLNGSGRRMNPSVEVMGSGSEKSRKRRLKLNRKLKLKLRFSISPKKLLLGFRDGYVNFMKRIANTSLVTGRGFVGGSGGGGGYGSNVVNGFGVRTLKEYDDKMIVEIYGVQCKSLAISQSQLVACDVTKLGRQVISQ